VPRDELEVTLEAVHQALEKIGNAQVTNDENVSKVSVVGLGMARQTGVADCMFRALAENDINIQMITTSEIKISVLVHRDEAQKALRTVHQAFDLDQAPADAAGDAHQALQNRSATDAADVVARLQGVGMEELMIDDIAMDPTQASVTIRGVPDTPGVAARVFDEVAQAGIFVDMIVQSFGHDGLANMSFTVPKEKLEESVTVAQQLAKTFKCQEVTSTADVAKLSVSGIGLRSHTGVAIRMFDALSSADINVAMINTSEVRVNVIIDGPHGPTGLAALQNAFADALR